MHLTIFLLILSYCSQLYSMVKDNETEVTSPVGKITLLTPSIAPDTVPIQVLSKSDAVIFAEIEKTTS